MEKKERKALWEDFFKNLIIKGFCLPPTEPPPVCKQMGEAEGSLAALAPALPARPSPGALFQQNHLLLGRKAGLEKGRVPAVSVMAPLYTHRKLRLSPWNSLLFSLWLLRVFCITLPSNFCGGPSRQTPVAGDSPSSVVASTSLRFPLPRTPGRPEVVLQIHFPSDCLAFL